MLILSHGSRVPKCIVDGTLCWFYGYVLGLGTTTLETRGSPEGIPNGSVEKTELQCGLQILAVKPRHLLCPHGHHSSLANLGHGLSMPKLSALLQKEFGQYH